MIAEELLKGLCLRICTHLNLTVQLVVASILACWTSQFTKVCQYLCTMVTLHPKIAVSFILFSVFAMILFACSWWSLRRYLGYQRYLEFDEMNGWYIDKRNGKAVCPQQECQKGKIPPYMKCSNKDPLRFQCPNCRTYYPPLPRKRTVYVMRTRNQQIC